MEVKKLSSSQFIVKSDSGESYKVSLSGVNKDQAQCTCKGFVFRRTCKHVDKVSEILRGDGKILKAKALPKEGFDFLESYRRDIDTVVAEFKEAVCQRK